MNTKTMAGISLAAIFAVAMIMPASANGLSFLHFDNPSVVEPTENSNPNNPNKRLKIHIDTGDTIPLDNTMGPAFGWGVMTDKGANDLEPDNVYVLATHLPIDDTAGEEDDSGLHTHVLDLKGFVDDEVDCMSEHGAPFEVDVEESLKNKGFDLESDWEVDDDEIWLGNVPIKLLNSDDVDIVVSFQIFPIPDDAETVGELDHLCVLPNQIDDHTE